MTFESYYKAFENQFILLQGDGKKSVKELMHLKDIAMMKATHEMIQSITNTEMIGVSYGDLKEIIDPDGK